MSARQIPAPLAASGLAQERAAAALETRQRADAIAAQRAAGRTSRKTAAERKEHRATGLPAGWHALCVSIPREQLEQLDAKLATLRAGGLTGMNRSKLIRIALQLVELEAIAAVAGRAR